MKLKETKEKFRITSKISKSKVFGEKKKSKSIIGWPDGDLSSDWMASFLTSSRSSYLMNANIMLTSCRLTM